MFTARRSFLHLCIILGFISVVAVSEYYLPSHFCPENCLSLRTLGAKLPVGLHTGWSVALGAKRSAAFLVSESEDHHSPTPPGEGCGWDVTRRISAGCAAQFRGNGPDIERELCKNLYKFTFTLENCIRNCKK